MHAKVLICATTWFAMPARAALAFHKAGARVFAIVPHGSPVKTVRTVEKLFAYSPINPIHSLTDAIEQVKPDLIVPCDDRVVEHLHRLFEEAAETPGRDGLTNIIKRSIGSPSGYPVASSRGQLLHLARELGVAIPESAVVQRREELKTWLLRHGYPAVLKVDGTWGGTGVRIVQSWDEADRAFGELTPPMKIMDVLGLLSSHNLYPLFCRQKSFGVTVQSYIDGYAANSMCACWGGDVLDQLIVQTLFAVDPLGSSTIIKTTSHPQIREVGKVLAKALEISGFCGFDFIIDKKSGTAYLIELNPRITQIGHIELAARPNLISMLYQRLIDVTAPGAADSPLVEETFALFPHILRCGANNPYIHSRGTRYDVPWEEPELIRELMRKPWNGRHISSYLFSIVRRLGRGDLERLFRRPVKKGDPNNLEPGTMPNNV